MVDLALDSAAGPSSRWTAALRRGGSRLWVGAALVAVLVLVALAAPLIAPHDPLEQDLMSAQLPPAWSSGGDAAYWLGTHCLCPLVVSRFILSAPSALAGPLIP